MAYESEKIEHQKFPGYKNRKGKIIILNGTSSAGKTTLAEALQKDLGEPYFLVQLDAFEDMIPERFLTGKSEEYEALTLSAQTMNNSIAYLSSRGVNVIVDTVFINYPGFDTWLKDCVQALWEYDVFFIGVHCPIHELERREKERGDRDIGQAKWQFDKVHTHKIYDIEVNSYENTIEECVKMINEKLDFGNDQNAFAKLNNLYKAR